MNLANTVTREKEAELKEERAQRIKAEKEKRQAGREKGEALAKPREMQAKTL